MSSVYAKLTSCWLFQNVECGISFAKTSLKNDLGAP